MKEPCRVYTDGSNCLTKGTVPCRECRAFLDNMAAEQERDRGSL